MRLQNEPQDDGLSDNVHACKKKKASAGLNIGSALMDEEEQAGRWRYGKGSWDTLSAKYSLGSVARAYPFSHSFSQFSLIQLAVIFFQKLLKHLF